MSEAPAARPEHQVTVEIDTKPVTSPTPTHVGELLALVHIDPAQRELVRVQGRHQTPYPDIDAVLELHRDEKFITVSVGPTPVS